jgi:hypothetical protein
MKEGRKERGEGKKGGNKEGREEERTETKWCRRENSS